MKNFYSSLLCVPHINSGMIEYTSYVCSQRAIPAITDGLKSSQRIAIWQQKQDGDKNVKVQALSGSMVKSNLYVHGDASNAISMMAAPFLNNNPLFIGHGSFGTLVEPAEFAAPRYTSVTFSKFTKVCVLADQDLLTLVPSVDGDNEMCSTFLPTIPTVLLNGTKGIATGYSTSIMPHKLSDLKRAVKNKLAGKYIKNIDPSFDRYDVDIKAVDELSYMISGKISIINTTTVHIDSLPPSMTLDKLQDVLFSLKSKGKISSFQNNVSDTFNIVVKMKRQELANYTEKSLVKMFKLSAKISERLVVVDFDGKSIKQYEDHDTLITDWVDWRFAFYKKRYQLLVDRDTLLLRHSSDIEKCFEAGLPNQLSFIESKIDLENKIEGIIGTVDEKIVGFASYKWTKEYRDKNIQMIKEINSRLALIHGF